MRAEVSLVYKNEKKRNWQKRCHNHLPNPYEENLISKYEEMEGRYQCAFISKKSLKKWFNKSEIKRLYQFGYRVYKFQIERKNLIKGKSQVIFKYNSKKYNIEELRRIDILREE